MGGGEGNAPRVNKDEPIVTESHVEKGFFCNGAYKAATQRYSLVRACEVSLSAVGRCSKTDKNDTESCSLHEINKD